MSIWGGSAISAAGSSNDPTQATATDVNAEVSRADLDGLQSQLDVLSTSLGSLPASLDRQGSAYERLAYLDDALNQSTDTTVTNLQTLLDQNGGSRAILATATNRYNFQFKSTGDGLPMERANDFSNSTVTNCIHNVGPVTVREALIDLDAATQRVRNLTLGQPDGGLQLEIVQGGSGFSAGSTYDVTTNGNGSDMKIRVQRVDSVSGAAQAVIVVHSGFKYAVDDLISVSNTDSLFKVTKIVTDSLRTTATLGNMKTDLNCALISDDSDTRHALQALDAELQFVRSTVGTSSGLTDMGAYGSSYIPDHKNIREVLVSVGASLANPKPRTLEVTGHTQLDGTTEINTDDTILLKTSKAIDAQGVFPLRIEGNVLTKGDVVHVEGTGDSASALKLTSTSTKTKALHLKATASTHPDAVFVEGHTTVSGNTAMSGNLSVSGTTDFHGALDAHDQNITGVNALSTTTLASTGLVSAKGGISLLDGTTKRNIDGANTVTAQNVHTDTTTATHLVVARAGGTVKLGHDTGDAHPVLQIANSQVEITSASTAIRTSGNNAADPSLTISAASGIASKGSLTHAGTTALEGALTVGSSGANATTTLHGTLTAHGAATLGSTLSTTGAMSTSSTLSVAHAATLDDTLTVKKATTLEDSLHVHEPTTLDKRLTVVAQGTDVTGSSIFRNDLEVKGATTLDAGVTLNGNAVVVNTGSIDASSTPTTIAVKGDHASALQVKKGSTTIVGIDTSGTHRVELNAGTLDTSHQSTAVRVRHNDATALRVQSTHGNTTTSWVDVDTTAGGKVTVRGSSTHLTGTATVDGATTLKQSVEMGTLTSDATKAVATVTNDALVVEGRSDLKAKLTVHGGGVVVEENNGGVGIHVKKAGLRVDEGLTSLQATKVHKTLEVTESATLTDSLVVGAALTANGATTVNNTLTIKPNGTASVLHASATQVTASVPLVASTTTTVGDTLTVNAGGATITGAANKPITIQGGGLDVKTATSLESTLGVTAQTNLNGGLVVKQGGVATATADNKLTVHRGGLHVEQGGADMHSGGIVNAGAVAGVSTLVTSDTLTVGGGGAQISGGVVVASGGADVSGATTLQHTLTVQQGLTAKGGLSLLGDNNAKQAITHVDDVQTEKATVATSLTTSASSFTDLGGKVRVNHSGETHDVVLRGETVAETTGAVPTRLRVLASGVEMSANQTSAKVLPTGIQMVGDLDVNGNITTSGTNTGDLSAAAGTFSKKLVVQSEGAEVTGATILHDALTVGSSTATRNTTLHGPLSVSGNLTATATTNLKNTTVDGTLTVKSGNDILAVVGTGGLDAKTKGISNAGAVSGVTTLTTSGQATMGGAASVAGATTLNNTLDVVGQTHLQSALQVDGVAQFGHTLTVGTGAQPRDTTLHGKLSADDVIDAKNGIHMHNKNITNTNSIDTTSLTASGSTSTNTLAVTGTTALNDTLTVKKTTVLEDALVQSGGKVELGDTSTGAKLTMNLPAVVGGAPAVEIAMVGETKIQKTNTVLEVKASGVEIAGTTSIQGNTTATGDVSVYHNNALTASITSSGLGAGVATFTTMNVNGTTTVGGNVNVSGTIHAKGGISLLGADGATKKDVADVNHIATTTLTSSGAVHSGDVTSTGDITSSGVVTAKGGISLLGVGGAKQNIANVQQIEAQQATLAANLSVGENAPVDLAQRVLLNASNRPQSVTLRGETAIQVADDVGGATPTRVRVLTSGVDMRGNVSVTGNGAFSGSLTAAEATLSGNLGAAAGTFSSNLSAVKGTFSDDLSAVKGTFSGDLSAVKGTFSGDLSAVKGTFSSDLSAVKGTFSDDLSAVKGTFSKKVKVQSEGLEVTGPTQLAGNLSVTAGNLSVTAGNLSVSGTGATTSLKATTIVGALSQSGGSASLADLTVSGSAVVQKNDTTLTVNENGVSVASGNTGDVVTTTASSIELHKPVTLSGGIVLPGSADPLLDALKIAPSGILTRDNRVSKLVALSGVASSSAHLGSFSQNIIGDDKNIKGALQDLETNLHTANGNISELDTRVGALNGLDNAFKTAGAFPTSVVLALNKQHGLHTALQGQHNALTTYVGTDIDFKQDGSTVTTGNSSNIATVVAGLNTLNDLRHALNTALTGTIATLQTEHDNLDAFVGTGIDFKQNGDLGVTDLSTAVAGLNALNGLRRTLRTDHDALQGQHNTLQGQHNALRGDHNALDAFVRHTDTLNFKKNGSVGTTDIATLVEGLNELNGLRNTLSSTLNTAIGNNGTSIASNAGGISTNATNISNNTTAIGVNANHVNFGGLGFHLSGDVVTTGVVSNIPSIAQGMNKLNDRINTIVNDAPAALDTLKEIAEIIGDPTSLVLTLDSALNPAPAQGATVAQGAVQAQVHSYNALLSQLTVENATGDFNTTTNISVGGATSGVTDVTLNDTATGSLLQRISGLDTKTTDTRNFVDGSGTKTILKTADTPYTTANSATVVEALNVVGAKSIANATAVVNLGDVTAMSRNDTPYTSNDATIVGALRTAGLAIGPFVSGAIADLPSEFATADKGSVVAALKREVALRLAALSASNTNIGNNATAISTNATNIASNTTNIQNNGTAIAAETTSRLAAIGTLSNLTDLAGHTTSVTTALAQEIALRKGAISTEAAARTAAITAEQNARGAAIAAEQNARTAATTAEQNARAAAIAAETTARTNAIAASNANIAANADGIGQNAAAVVTNANAIATNATNISANAVAIANVGNVGTQLDKRPSHNTPYTAADDTIVKALNRAGAAIGQPDTIVDQLVTLSFANGTNFTGVVPDAEVKQYDSGGALVADAIVASHVSGSVTIKIDMIAGTFVPGYITINGVTDPLEVTVVTNDHTNAFANLNLSQALNQEIITRKKQIGQLDVGNIATAITTLNAITQNMDINFVTNTANAVANLEGVVGANLKSAGQTWTQLTNSAFGTDADLPATLTRISGELATETAARGAAITTEQNARTAAITAEQNARTAAVTAEQNARTTAITAETTARVAAINASNASIAANSNSIGQNTNDIGANAGDISTLQTTVHNITHNAPQALDTLKEIADIIGDPTSQAITLAGTALNPAPAINAVVTQGAGNAAVAGNVVSYAHPLLVVGDASGDFGAGSIVVGGVTVNATSVSPNNTTGSLLHRIGALDTKTTNTRNLVDGSGTKAIATTGTPYTAGNSATVVEALNVVGTKSIANATAIANLGDVSSDLKKNDGSGGSSPSDTPYTAADDTIVKALNTAGLAVGNLAVLSATPNALPNDFTAADKTNVARALKKEVALRLAALSTSNTNIGNNATAIATNVTNIADNATAIGANAGDISTNAGNLAAEINARTAAIAAEATARTTAITAEQNARTAAITAETTARTAAIAAETATRTVAINASNANIAANADGIGLNAVAITNNATAITNETNARTSAIASAVTAINTTIGDPTDFNGVSGLDANEFSAADKASIVKTILKEASLRKAADVLEASTRSNAISAEQTARASAITTEAAARIAADAAEASARTSAITAEQNARAAADANIHTLVGSSATDLGTFTQGSLAGNLSVKGALGTLSALLNASSSVGQTLQSVVGTTTDVLTFASGNWLHSTNPSANTTDVQDALTKISEEVQNVRDASGLAIGATAHAAYADSTFSNFGLSQGTLRSQLVAIASQTSESAEFIRRLQVLSGNGVGSSGQTGFTLTNLPARSLGDLTGAFAFGAGITTGKDALQHVGAQLNAEALARSKLVQLTGKGIGVTSLDAYDGDHVDLGASTVNNAVQFLTDRVDHLASIVGRGDPTGAVKHMGTFATGTVLEDNKTVQHCLNTLDVASTDLRSALGSSTANMGSFATKPRFALGTEKSVKHLLQSIGDRIDAEMLLTDNLQSTIMGNTTTVTDLGTFSTTTGTFSISPNLTVKGALVEIANAIDQVATFSVSVGAGNVNTWTADGNLKVSQQISVGSASVGNPHVIVGEGDLQVSNSITTHSLVASGGIVARGGLSLLGANNLRQNITHANTIDAERAVNVGSGSLTPLALGLNQSFQALHVQPAKVQENSSGTHAMVAGAKFSPFEVVGGGASTSEAATVVVAGATTGAATANHYALLVKGNTATNKLEGNLQVHGGTLDFGNNNTTVKLHNNSNSALTFADTGGVAKLVFDTIGDKLGLRMGTLDLSAQNSEILLANHATALKIGKSGTPLLTLDTATSPAATLAGDFNIGGDITRVAGNLSISAPSGTVSVENAVFNGNDATIPDKLSMTHNVSGITHTAASSSDGKLHISSQNNVVEIESVEFDGANVTTSGTVDAGHTETNTLHVDPADPVAGGALVGGAVFSTFQVDTNHAGTGESAPVIIGGASSGGGNNMTHYALLVKNVAGQTNLSKFEGNLNVSGGSVDVSATDTVLKLKSGSSTAFKIGKNASTPVLTMNTTNTSATFGGDVHITGDLHVDGGDIQHIGNDLTLTSTSGKVVVEGVEFNDRDILTAKNVAKFEHTGNTSLTVSSTAQLNMTSTGNTTMTAAQILNTAPTIKLNDIVVDANENVSGVNTLTATTLTDGDFSTTAGATTTKQLTVTDGLVDVSTKNTELRLREHATALTAGKMSNGSVVPLLVLNTTTAHPSANVTGDLNLTGDITGTNGNMAVSATGNMTVAANGGTVTVENVVFDGDDTTTPGDLIMTKPATSITHSGATSLTISSTNANVYVEEVEFDGKNITTAGTTTTTTLRDGMGNLSFRTHGGDATTKTMQVGKKSAAKTAVVEIQPDAQNAQQTHALLVNGATALSEFKGNLRVSGGLVDVSAATKTELRLADHATALTIGKAGTTPLLSLNTASGATPSATLAGNLNTTGSFHLTGSFNTSNHIAKASGHLDISAERVRVVGEFDLAHTKKVRIAENDASALSFGKASDLGTGGTPLLRLSTLSTNATPSATLAGNLHLTGGNITRTDSHLLVSSANGHVQIENVTIDGDNTTTPGDLAMTKNAAAITHSGATSLTISSTNAAAKVVVETTEFQGNDVTTLGITTSGTLRDGSTSSSFTTTGGTTSTTALTTQTLVVENGIIDASNKKTELRLKEDAAALTVGKMSNGGGSIVPLLTLNTTAASPKLTLAGDLTATGEQVRLEGNNTTITHSGSTALSVVSTQGKLKLQSGHADADAIQSDGKLTLKNIGTAQAGVTGDSLRIHKTTGQVTRDDRVENMVALSGVTSGNTVATHLGVFPRPLLSHYPTTDPANNNASVTFTQKIIPDNSTVKTALDKLNTATDGHRLALGVNVNAVHLGTFAGSSHFSLTADQTVKQALKETADKLSVTAKNTQYVTSYVGANQLNQFAPTTLVSSNAGFGVAVQTGQNGTSPGIVMGNTTGSGDHSLGSYKNPQIFYDTSTVHTSGSQLGQSAPTLKLFSQQMELRLTSDADLETVKPNSGLSLYDYGIKAQHMLLTSDQRLKKNIVDTEGALAKLRALKSRTFDYVDEREEPGMIGFIAQEVKEAIPRAVSTHRAVCPTEYRQIDDAQWTQRDATTWVLTIPDLAESEHDQVYRIYYNDRTKFWDLKNHDGNSFVVRVASPPEGPLFLYGKFVNDLQHIDRDDVFNVLYAATREIDRLVVQNTTKLASLEARIAALENQ